MSRLTVYKKKVRAGLSGGCQHPKCSATTNLTVDHIVPIVFLKCLEMSDYANTEEENFQVLCQRHNKEKGSKLDYTNPKTLPLMKKYINIWIEKHGDYFIAPEKRVYKIGVKCRCGVSHETIEPDEVTHRGQTLEIPPQLDMSKWNNRMLTGNVVIFCYGKEKGS